MQDEKVTIGIPSKDRGIELCLLLYSLLDQTHQNYDILIINDNSNNFLTENSTFLSLLNLHKQLNHNIEIIKGDIKGPHYSGKKILKNSKTELIFRVDDDVTLRPNCLEELVKGFKVDENIAACGPIYLLPYLKIEDQNLNIDLNNSNLKDLTDIREDTNGYIITNSILQMNLIINSPQYIETKHLHSGFMYKKSAIEEINGYFLGYSIVGHREETDTSYRLYLNNKKLLICTKAICFHYHPNFGGIRTNNLGKQNENIYWENDEKIFKERFKNKFKDNNIDEVNDNINKIKENKIEKINTTSIVEKPCGKNLYNTVCIVIVSHGNSDNLIKLLKEINEYTTISKYCFSIVWNDTNEEEFEKILKSISTIPIYNVLSLHKCEKEISVSEARNIGYKNSPLQINYICFLDDDCDVLGKWEENDDWLSILVKKFNEEIDTGAVSPIYTWFEELEINSLSVACLLTTKKVLDHIGGFDTFFGNKKKGTWGYEDVDFSYRLQSSGYKIKGIDSEHYPLYHEDTTFKQKQKWQEEGLIKAREAIIDKYKEYTNISKKIYPFTKDQMNIISRFNSKNLNIGCYYMKLENFINVDINEECNPDILKDIRELNFEDNSIDLILASQVLEHFIYSDCTLILNNFFKWLKIGGHLIIEVPDIGVIMEKISTGKAKFEEYRGAIIGNLDIKGQKHEMQFDYNSLTKLLKDTGFMKFEVNRNTSNIDEITLRFDIVR